MTEEHGATPLEIHTLDSLCTELVSGRAVLVGGDGKEFCFESLEARALFAWYRQNRGKWEKNVQKMDVELLVDQLEKLPPTLPSLVSPQGSQEPRVLHLKSMKVHRFGGIHGYGSPEVPPEDFEFTFEKPVTLVEGKNGAGKTSLLSAITWCLTGYVYRPQRAPETAAEAIQVKVVDSPESGGDEPITNEIAAVTPLPSAMVLRALRGAPVPLDTWVELTLVDPSGHEVARLRRSVERSRNDRVRVVEPNLSMLQLSPISLEVGTRMPALIPYVQLGEPSDLGQAVAAMTGIKPLQDLARHATRSRARLQKDLVDDRMEDITALDEDYEKVRDELLALLQQHPEIRLEQEIPASGVDRTLEEQLDACARQFVARQTRAFSECKGVLGEGFDPSDPSTQQDLVQNVAPAIGLLDFASLSRLRGAARLHGLAELTDEQLRQADELVRVIRDEAIELARLAEQPDVASRLQLYARVAGWIKAQPEPHAVDDCPVCLTSLASKIDPVTGLAVRDHLQRYVEEESRYLERTLVEWQSAGVERLAGLAGALAAESKRDLPGKPGDLLTSALAEELFESQQLRTVLNPLKAATVGLCHLAVDAMPAFVEPEPMGVPACFGEEEGGVATALRRVGRAVAFARWRKAHADGFIAAFNRVIGQPRAADNPRPESTAEWSLRDRLGSLDDLVRAAAPLREALVKVETLRKTLAARRKKEERIAAYARAARAIEPLVELDGLVEQQVGSLLATLCSEMKVWRNRLYGAAFSGAPSIYGADAGTDGTLVLDAAADGSRAPAHHISNASELRASLVAFLLAFWEYLLKRRGGISLLLFDDLHELFDPENQRRVANTMPAVVEGGGRLIITFNDPKFGRSIVRAFAEAQRGEEVDHRELHTRNTVRTHIELGAFRDEVDRKRARFERPENENEHQPARDYFNQLRIYLEQRLLDFFDGASRGLSDKPTLSDLIGAIRSARNTGAEPFVDQAFGALVDDAAVSQGSEFLRLMNEAHHGRADVITYGTVEAQSENCVRVFDLVGEAENSYERWLRRDLPRDAPVLPEAPAALTLRVYRVPMIRDLAAFTAELGSRELTDSGETFGTDTLNSHAVYVVRSRSLGFAGPSGCRVLVRTAGDPAPDNSLVVGLAGGRTVVGRLHREASRPDIVVIGSEAEDPLKRSPSRFLRTNEVRLLQVVGVLFDLHAEFSRSREDAVFESSCGILDRIEVVFSVHEDSALPLAIAGQKVLGGGRLLPSQVANMEGRIVAIETSDGAYLKRIGCAVPRALHVRQFEAVGGLGDSLLARTEEVDEDRFGDVPLLHAAREILGVIY